MNGVRQFGMAGLGITNSGYGTIQQTATSTIASTSSTVRSYSWGNDFNNATVASAANFNAAVAMLRSFNGRTTYNAGGYVYPAAWNQVETNMGTTDTSSAGAELVGNPSATVKSLNAVGISTLVVNWLSCTTNAFVFTSLNPNAGAYWAERWELYKHQYVLAGWAWKRGITRTEYWVRPPPLRLARVRAHADAPRAGCVRRARTSRTWARRASTAALGLSTSRCAARPSRTRTQILTRTSPPAHPGAPAPRASPAPSVPW